MIITSILWNPLWYLPCIMDNFGHSLSGESTELFPAPWLGLIEGRHQISHLANVFSFFDCWHVMAMWIATAIMVLTLRAPMWFDCVNLCPQYFFLSIVSSVTATELADFSNRLTTCSSTTIIAWLRPVSVMINTANVFRLCTTCLYSILLIYCVVFVLLLQDSFAVQHNLINMNSEPLST